ALGLRDRRFHNPNTFAVGRRRQFALLKTIYHERIILSVDIQIKPKRKEVIVVHTNSIVADKESVFVLAWRSRVYVVVRSCSLFYRFRLDNAGSTHGHTNGSVLLEPPVQQIVVVADYCRAPQYQRTHRAPPHLSFLRVPPRGVPSAGLEEARDSWAHHWDGLFICREAFHVCGIGRAVHA